jgi:glycosyltransferase involved in cell wall biosynthesis
MSVIANAWVVDNARWAAAEPRLSVLVPLLHDDPPRLLETLAAEAPACGGQVEIVVLDDGGGDDELGAGVIQTVENLALPARAVRLVRNEGRAKGRNRLAANARGGHLLFLDSDMLPDTPDFLERWLGLAAGEDPPVAFGGFSLKQTPFRREHRLHRQMARRSDCAPAVMRRRTPEKYVFTSNLLVRREVFDAEAFDERFTGWGWEDVEWGIRVSRRWPIVHVDNTATHLGLDDAATIAAKYEQSAANFGRVCRAHADIVKSYPGHKVARLMRRTPLRRAWSRVFKGLALAEFAPLRLRAFSLRLYRASIYAETV